MSDILNGERWRVDEGDCLTWLRGLPDGIAQTCVCSPPYWGLRDYGEPGQLGLEPTPEEYVSNMVAVFAEVRRVLRGDGVLWLNIGDSYAHDNPNGPQGSGGERASRTFTAAGAGGKAHGLKPKDLCMIPARVALALQAGFSTCDTCGLEQRTDLWPARNGHRICIDCLLGCKHPKVIQTEPGWWLRSDIAWTKPNPMPESVTDRPTSAHEHVFLLAKSERYFYDAFAVREAASPDSLKRISQENFDNQTGGPKDYGATGVNTSRSARKMLENFAATGGQTRNLRNVWEIPTQGTPEAHFATYPEKLVEPCIKAGSSDRACVECGAPWERVVQRGNSGHHCRPGCGCHEKQREAGEQNWEEGWRDYGNYSSTAVDTGIFEPTCGCNAETTGSIVIDPFTGSGTTGRVALRLGRRFLGCELNPDYAAMARRRIVSYHVKPVRPRKDDGDQQAAFQLEVPA